MNFVIKQHMQSSKSHQLIFSFLGIFLFSINLYAQEIPVLNPISEKIYTRQYYFVQTQPVFFENEYLSHFIINNEKTVFTSITNQAIQTFPAASMQCFSTTGGSLSVLNSILYQTFIYSNVCEKGLVKFDINKRTYETIKIGDGLNISGMTQIQDEKIILLTQDGLVIFYDLETLSIEKSFRIKGSYHFRSITSVNGELYAIAYHPVIKQVNLLSINQQSGYARILHDTEMVREVFPYQDKLIAISNFIWGVMKIIDLNSELSVSYLLNIAFGKKQCLLKASNIINEKLITYSLCESDQLIISTFNIPKEIP